MSKIEWTERTWNPIVGCSVTSPGCKNCYAMNMAGRLEAMNAKTGKIPHYAGTTQKVKGKTVWTGHIGRAHVKVWAEPLRRKKPTRYFVNSMGDLFHPNVQDADIDRVFAIMAVSPQHTFQILTKYPERMRDYVNDENAVVRVCLHQKSMRFEWPCPDPDKNYPAFYRWCALYAKNVAWLCEGGAAREMFKRDEPNRIYPSWVKWPLPNVWLGVSVEDQKHTDLRIPALLDTPAAVRFVSAEPLLGPVDLTAIACPQSKQDKRRGPENALISAVEGIRSKDTTRGRRHHVWPALDWVIIGGESGPGARPMHPDWARALRDQCESAGVAFFFKQWGAWLPWEPADPPFFTSQAGDYVDGHVAPWLDDSGECLFEDPDCHRWDVDYEPSLVVYERSGKKAAGRLLDGVAYDGLPGAAAIPSNL